MNGSRAGSTESMVASAIATRVVCIRRIARCLSVNGLALHLWTLYNYFYRLVATPWSLLPAPRRLFLSGSSSPSRFATRLGLFPGSLFSRSRLSFSRLGSLNPGPNVWKCLSIWPHDHRSARIAEYWCGASFSCPISGATHPGVPKYPSVKSSSSLTKMEMLKSVIHK